MQVSYGLEALFGIPDRFTTQALVVTVLMVVYLTSAVSGVSRGIQLLSRANMILGGAGIGLEIREPGVVAEAMQGFNLPAALLVIAEALPFGFIVSLLFLLLTTIFVATTGDSMTYSLSVTLANSDQPPAALRVFWGLAMGTMALLLLSMGSGGIGKLQSFIVVSAVPVSMLLLPALWSAPAIALATPPGKIRPSDTYADQATPDPGTSRVPRAVGATACIIHAC